MNAKSVFGGPVSFDEKVRLDRIRVFFGLAKGNMSNILFGTVLIGIVLHIGGASAYTLAIWSGLIAVGSVAVILFERYVQNIGITVRNCEGLLRTRIALGALIAFLWGIAGYLLPSQGTQVQDTFIFIILSTLVTVGALGYAAMPAYYLILDAVSLIPLSIKFAICALSSGDRYYLLLLVLSLIWQSVVLKKARRVSRTVIDAIEVNERLKDEIAEHERTRTVLQQMAQRDPLTGLANRTLFSDRLNQTLALAQRTDSIFALLYIDLDRFKPVNDRFGHAVGDVLLKEVATRMLDCVRESDTVARVGGDEFVVLLREIVDTDSAMGVAEKIRLALNDVFLVEGHEIHIGCCVGVAMYPGHGRSEIELASHADAAMFRAKQEGRNTIRLADPVRGQDTT